LYIAFLYFLIINLNNSRPMEGLWHECIEWNSGLRVNPYPGFGTIEELYNVLRCHTRSWGVDAGHPVAEIRIHPDEGDHAI
jgi:hypothetical protein